MTGRRERVAAVRSIVAVTREFEQAARGAEMSLAQYRLLLFLANGPRRAGELAALQLVTKGTISPQLASLRDRGWVEDRPDGDRRVSRLALTAAGRAQMNRFEGLLDQCLAQLLQTDEADDGAASIYAGLQALYVALGRTRETRFDALWRS